MLCCYELKKYILINLTEIINVTFQAKQAKAAENRQKNEQLHKRQDTNDSMSRLMLATRQDAFETDIHKILDIVRETDRKVNICYSTAIYYAPFEEAPVICHSQKII